MAKLVWLCKHCQTVAHGHKCEICRSWCVRGHRNSLNGLIQKPKPDPPPVFLTDDPIKEFRPKHALNKDVSNKKKRQAIYDRDGNACLCCANQRMLTLDHVLPQCEGGSDAVENLQTLCDKCNNLKAGLTIDFRVPSKSVYEQLDRILSVLPIRSIKELRRRYMLNPNIHIIKQEDAKE